MLHREEHVSKMFSTMAIDYEGYALNLVRGYILTGEDTNVFTLWL